MIIKYTRPTCEQILIRERDDSWNTYWSYVYQVEISLRCKIERDGSFQ